MWAVVRQAHLQTNPKCEVCGGTKKVQVHHIVPFHIDPSKELDFTNLITLCESKKKGINCHLFVGHLGDFKSSNPTVAMDAQVLKEKLSKKLV